MAIYIILALVALFIALNLLLALSKTFSPIPYFPTQSIDLDKIITALDLKKGDILYDLGAGDGKILLAAANRYPNIVKGVEIHPLLVALMHFRRLIHPHKKQIQVIWQSLFKLNIMDATVIYLYVGPFFMRQIMRKIIAEHPPRLRRIVSYWYDFQLDQPISWLARTRKIQGKNTIYIIEKK